MNYDSKVSIIIVNYNSGNYLQRCLNSIYNSLKINYEVVVVDNASTDDSIEQCHKYINRDNFTFLQLKDNLGFAKANNIGVSLSSGSILHFLNPDTEINDTMNEDYNSCLKNPQYIYVNRLINPDKTFVKSKHVIITIRNVLAYFLHCKNIAFWYIGASVIISKNNFYKIGKWNESFFMYSEDLDLFYKAYIQKIETKWLTSIIFHVGGGSSSKVWNSLEREIQIQKSLRKFYIVNGIAKQFLVYKLIAIVFNFLYNRHNLSILLKAWKEVDS